MADVLAQDYQVLAESPDPQNVFAGSPALGRLHGGRLVAPHDWFRTDPDKEKIPNQGQVLTSDDGGCTWTKRASTDLMRASPFALGEPAGRLFMPPGRGENRTGSALVILPPTPDQRQPSEGQ